MCLVAALAASSCNRQPDGEPDRALTSGTVQGCWSLELPASQDGADSLGAWLPAGSLPSILQLDTARAATEADAREIYRARSYVGRRVAAGPFSAWRWFSGDSILVDRPGALAGLTLRLTRADGHLEGVVTSYTDVMEPGEPTRRSAPVRATPASCPADEGPPGSSADRG